MAYGAKIPHRSFGLTPVHVIYRLFGSIPQKVLQRIKEERDRSIEELERVSAAIGRSPKTMYFKQQMEAIDDRLEVLLDDGLHRESNGPYYLAQPEIAQEVLNSWRFLHREERVYVYAVCVMSNHVHVLVRCLDGTEEVPAGPVMEAHKKYTARVSNLLLERTGSPFWEPSYFDRDVREGKFNSVMWYILNNPWKAGMVRRWTEHPFTWLNPEFEELFTP